MKGIFGAMNQGFSYALPSEYILFWGSDDWAASPDVFSLLASEIDKSLMTGHSPHLIISSARYVDQNTGSFLRNSCFSTSSFLNRLLIPVHFSRFYTSSSRCFVFTLAVLF